MKSSFNIRKMGHFGIPFISDDKTPGTLGYTFTFNKLPGCKMEPQFLFRNIPVEQYGDTGDLLLYIKRQDLTQVYHT